MPSLYTENSERWRNLASIDYFTHFVKAWIPFNAWYRTYHPELDTDRKAIEAIKAQPNKFRDRLVSLLNDNDNDGIAFKFRISELHLALERKYLFNNNNRITFQQISIENNPVKQNSFQYNGLTYKVERGMPNRKGEIDIFIVSKSNKNKFSYTQTNGFDLSDLTCCQDFISLFLNSKFGYLQVERRVHGVAYYSISQPDLANLLIPILPKKQQQKIVEKIKSSFSLKLQSKQLLEIAKTGVERAIETDEATATAWINQQLEALGVSLR
jgi:restriction endonuclease S subunit